MKIMDYTYELHRLESKALPFILPDKTTEGMFNIFNWHREIEFLYVTQGSGIFMSDADSFELSKGDIFAVNSNCMHTTREEKKLGYRCFIVDAQFCIDNGIRIDEIVLNPKISDPKAAELFEDIIEQYKYDDEYCVAAIRSSVLAFLVYLVRNHAYADGPHGKEAAKKSVRNMRAATDYIKNHFNERLTLDEIASYVGLNRCHFAREFKRLMGITPVNYINMLRCETAMKMLRGGKYTVGEIQLRCGFDNASYFTKVFKKYFGKTPVSFLTD